MSMIQAKDLSTKITIGDSEIIDSGVLLLEEDEVVTYNISSPGIEFCFKFSFIKDTQRKKDDGSLKQDFDYQVSSNEQGNSFLDFKFINMEDARSAGNIRKVKLAHVSGRQISFKFRILAVGKNPINYQLSYTWFLEPKPVGETSEVK